MPTTRATERTPLLCSERERESTLDYATHIPEDAPVVEHKHYNLAGLSQTDFWVLVRRERKIRGRADEQVYLNVVVLFPKLV
jgi:hypothetical protein